MNSRPFEIEKAFRKNYTMLDHIVNVFTIWSPLKLSNHMIGVLKGSYGEPEGLERQILLWEEICIIASQENDD